MSRCILSANALVRAFTTGRLEPQAGAREGCLLDEGELLRALESLESVTRYVDALQTPVLQALQSSARPSGIASLFSDAKRLFPESALNGMPIDPAPAISPAARTMRDLPYDQAAFLTAHNAYALAGEFRYRAANQTMTIPQLLEAGARGFMLDVHPAEKPDGSLSLCHKWCWRGRTDLGSTLKALKGFLDEPKNREEVITIIIEDYVPNAEILKAFEDAGLADYLYKKPDGQPWPTLGEMWDSNRRLVVFTQNEQREAAVDGIHIAYDRNIWGNQYGQVEDHSLVRGKEKNGLVEWNQFLSSYLGFGPMEERREVNRGLSDRAREFFLRYGRYPNFVALDWIGYGEDAAGLVRRMNEETLGRAYANR